MRRRRCEARRKGAERKGLKKGVRPLQAPRWRRGGRLLSHPADLPKGTCSGSLCKDNKCEYHIHKKAAAREGGGRRKKERGRGREVSSIKEVRLRGWSVPLKYKEGSQ